jgi:hypothetical protein
MSLADKGVRKAPPVADDSKKWLEWSEFLGVVRRLRAEAAGRILVGCSQLDMPMVPCNDVQDIGNCRRIIIKKAVFDSSWIRAGAEW